MPSGDPDDASCEKPRKNFEEVIFHFRYPIIFFLLGVILIGVGVFFLTSSSENKVEVLSETTTQTDEIIVEISGAVEHPGVYTFTSGARVEELLVNAGGLSSDANRDWVEKYLNRASKLTDGQKIFIPKENEENRQTLGVSVNNSGDYQTISSNFDKSGETLININTSDQKTLESLVGIGPKYAQNIIEQRPYSDIEELRTKSVIPVKTYDAIKNKITIY